MKADFSVILPFYRGDHPEYLDEALLSLYRQTLRASEIILIQDGPVPEQLQAIVQKWEAKLTELRFVVLSSNQGLAGALNAGIDEAQFEWIARMDADDICCKDRFARQWSCIEKNPELAIVGSWIEEFGDNPKEIIATRRLPGTHHEILSYARWRCPFNHMTVMYRKSALLHLGKYKDFGAVGDDYELWARFLMNGYKAANIQEPLVKARAGEAMISKRRRGMKYLSHEIREIRALYGLGLLKPWHFIFHVALKALVRLSPPSLVKFIYQAIRKTS